MNNLQSIISMCTILPEADQNLLYEIAKKLLLAFDPEYIKVLPSEKAELDKILIDIKEGTNIGDENEINW